MSSQETHPAVLADGTEPGAPRFVDIAERPLRIRGPLGHEIQEVHCDSVARTEPNRAFITSSAPPELALRRPDAALHGVDPFLDKYSDSFRGDGPPTGVGDEQPSI